MPIFTRYSEATVNTRWECATCHEHLGWTESPEALPRIPCLREDGTHWTFRGGASDTHLVVPVVAAPWDMIPASNHYGQSYFLRRTYVGCVLETRERNYRDDSDFYAVVWDEAAQAVTTVEYATTRFATDDNNAVVDATPEVRAKVEDWTIRQLVPQAIAQERERASRQALALGHGSQVLVVRGRKVAKGTVAEVVKIVASSFGTRWGGPAPDRALLRLLDGSTAWTSVSNLEPIGPSSAAVIPSTTQIAKRVIRGVRGQRRSYMHTVPTSPDCVRV